MAALGASEHGPDQPIEQVDGGIGQAGAEVEAAGDQRRVPPLPLIAGHVLHRHAGGLARELRQARLMDQVAAACIDAEGANMLQTRDQAEHGGGLAACGICRSQVSQLWPVSFRRCNSASRRLRWSTDRS